MQEPVGESVIQKPSQEEIETRYTPEECPARHHRLDQKHVRVVDMTQQPADELGVVGKSIHAESIRPRSVGEGASGVADDAEKAKTAPNCCVLR